MEMTRSNFYRLPPAIQRQRHFRPYFNCKMKAFFISILCFASALTCTAADFFSTEKPDQFMNLGVRVGLNTSNITASGKVFNGYNVNSWGLGFNAGIIADINIRDYIAVQPGFFYESRSGNFAYQQVGTEGTADYQLGHLRSYHFTVPILASMRFNISDDVRWIVDFGPYVSFKLKSNYDPISFSSYEPDGLVTAKSADMAKADFGFKMGTGIKIRGHWYFGIHYSAGALHAWKQSYMKGHNKSWDFTIGFDI